MSGAFDQAARAKLSLNVREALRALRANLLRSVLTTLGVVIGVASVIVMVAIGAGTEKRIQEEIERLGTNTIVLNPGVARTSGVSMGVGTRPTLTDDDAKALAAAIPRAMAVAPFVRGNVQAIAGKANWSTVGLGVTDQFLVAREWVPRFGRAFLPEELVTGRKVVLLGATVAEKLFPGEDPTDRPLRINHLSFRVIGVLEPKGQTMSGADLDDIVLVPLLIGRNSLFGRALGSPRSLRSIIVKGANDADLEALEKDIRQVLRERHRLTEDQPDDFFIQNLSEIMQMREASSSALTTLLAAVASISLLVGGIGIMNIMLVSVTERTREIGIRAAVGAGPKDLLLQFLVEAATLSMIGATIGVVLGITSTIVAEQWFHVRTALSLGPLLIASLFAGVVGIAFGFYPAWKAARVPPIEALRYE